MAAILLGSIGTIADTSELQRSAFNKAFTQLGLDWHWPREKYITLLGKSGGQQRIETYAQSIGQSVDAAAIHRLKSDIFQRTLRSAQLEPRPGVVDTIQTAKQHGLKLGFVTTTSAENVAALFEAVGQFLSPSDFDRVVNRSHVQHPKPAKDAYLFALKALGEAPSSCIAVEDNLGGFAAAQSAGLTCIAFPGENTVSGSFAGAPLRTERLRFEAIAQFLPHQGTAEASV